MDTDIDTIEEGFASIPEEVKAYIYSAHFRALFDALCAEHKLAPETVTLLKNSLYSYIAQIKTEEDLLKTIQAISTTPEMSQSIIVWISTNVTDPILELVTLTYMNVDDEEEETGNTTTPTSPGVLTSMNQAFLKPTIFAPTKRTYTDPTPVPTTPKTVDPYRELPDEKQTVA